MHQHHSKTKAVPTEGKSQSQNVILSCQVEDCKFQRVHKKLTILNLQDSEISQILEDVSKGDLFKQYHKGPIKSNHTRKSFFRESFNYVEATKISLGADEAVRE